MNNETRWLIISFFAFTLGILSGSLITYTISQDIYSSSGLQIKDEAKTLCEESRGDYRVKDGWGDMQGYYTTHWKGFWINGECASTPDWDFATTTQI